MNAQDQVQWDHTRTGVRTEDLLPEEHQQQQQEIHLFASVRRDGSNRACEESANMLHCWCFICKAQKTQSKINKTKQKSENSVQCSQLDVVFNRDSSEHNKNTQSQSCCNNQQLLLQCRSFVLFWLQLVKASFIVCIVMFISERCIACCVCCSSATKSQQTQQTLKFGCNNLFAFVPNTVRNDEFLPQ